ncbi:MAG: hypothetical protein E7301_01580 [Butyrivibrio sp.]|nr:hypothetical protein [Butyrivibrio sp.]
MILKILLCILTLIIIFVVLVICHDMNTFVVRNYEISSEKIAKDFSFCLLSDLHEKSYGKNNEKLIKKIFSLDPDAVIIAGDMITASNKLHSMNMGPAIDIIRAVSEKYPVYAANGNHEYKMFILEGWRSKEYRHYEDALRSRGVVLLRNTGTYLEEYNMEIHGLETSYEYYSKFRKHPMDDEYIKGFFGEPCSERFQLLIAHNPRYFEEYAKWGADLTVSGHVHGGIARLPFLGGVLSPALVPFPKYDGGLFTIGERHMILSRGLGMHTVPIRFNNPGELCFVTVRKKER